MICLCGLRMRCTFSVPVEGQLRFRYHRCLCGERMETVEMPLDRLDEDLSTIRSRAREGRQRYIMGSKYRKKKGQPRE